MDSVVREDDQMSTLEYYARYNPVTFLFGFLAAYGWYLVSAGVLTVLVYRKLKPMLEKYRIMREEAEHHRDPDKQLSRMEAIQRAREKQQQMLERDSVRALEAQKEREERKRAERVAALEKYGAATSGNKLGTDDGYLPLSGGSSTSTYRPPKKSKCSGGGCGK